MAVYTKVSAEEITAFLERFDVGQLVSAKGIAEGVENSNYLIETTRSRFILTLYEKRVDPRDLPFFINLLDHLSDKKCPVPPAIADKSGEQIQQLCGKSACLIAFLPGISVSHPTPVQAMATGRALGKMHQAAAGFTGKRENNMGLDEWKNLAAACGADGLNAIAEGLNDLVHAELKTLDTHWPRELPQAVIHADLFPDNVLMLDDKITGIIDFYFSCTDIRAYDLAVTHAAWCFSADGTAFDAGVSDALIKGYTDSFRLSEDERNALPLLARGAAVRFLLTRAFDWINTPADAMVTRKDPVAFLNRLKYYQRHQGLFSA